MAAWRVAEGLEVLLAQVNAAAPGRSKASDGSIGDPDHQQRDSDHNPDALGVVRARDFTHDPGHGADMGEIAEALRLSRDRRIKYAIFNRRVFSATNAPWTWRTYTGSNPHDKHLHVSVVPTDLADDTSPWEIEIGDDVSAVEVHNRIVPIQGDLKSSDQDVDTQAPAWKVWADCWRFGLDTRSLVIGFEAKDAARDAATAAATGELTQLVRDLLALVQAGDGEPELAPLVERLDALPDVIRTAANAGGQAGADRVLTQLAAAERAAAELLASPLPPVG